VLKIFDAAHFRRVVAGLCLVAAPLLFAAAEILTPQPSGSAAAQLAAFAEHRNQLLAGVLCGVASSMLFVPALFGLLHRIRDRGVVYAHVAAAMIIYGLVTAAALGAPLLAGHYLFALGIVLLGVAAWRARLAPRWAAILVALFPVADLALSPAGDVSSLVSDAIGIAGFAALGLRLLAMPDSEWDTAPVAEALPAPAPQPSRA
jgi:hypothetical protein